jgi:glycosyltransferase involved in cell wall biosynthesis
VGSEQFISVVLCNYNYADLIGATIESVLAQKYDAWELVIIDDGSPDNSREVIARYAEANPERIRTLFKDNEGQGQGFNDGVGLAKGDIVCFLDSDDIWLPGKLSMVNRWFSERDDIALLQHNMCIMRGESPTNENFRNQLGCGDLLEEARRNRLLPQFVPTSGLAFHRRVLDKILPIPKQFRTCADGYLTRTSICHGTVYAEPGTYGYYRRHENNCVLGNRAHNVGCYVNTLLVPLLNAYYSANGIDLELPTPRFRLDTIQHIRKIKSLKPWERLRCSPSFETLRGRLAEKGILIDPVDWRLKKLRGAYAGRECHVLGRSINPAALDWNRLEQEFVFVADVNALIPEVLQLREGMYCISDLRFWEGRWGVSPNMLDFLAHIPSLFKLFELPARPRRKDFPLYSPHSYLFKTVDRDFGIWKGNVTLDAVHRLMWGYHVVLDMCLPMAFHLGFSKVQLHGCQWEFLEESQRLRDFFTLYCYNNDYNLSENILPFSTAHGRTDLLWVHSLQRLVAEYGSRGMAILNSKQDEISTS